MYTYKRNIIKTQNSHFGEKKKKIENNHESTTSITLVNMKSAVYTFKTSQFQKEGLKMTDFK